MRLSPVIYTSTQYTFDMVGRYGGVTECEKGEKSIEGEPSRRVSQLRKKKREEIIRERSSARKGKSESCKCGGGTYTLANGVFLPIPLPGKTWVGDGYKPIGRR